MNSSDSSIGLDSEQDLLQGFLLSFHIIREMLCDGKNNQTHDLERIKIFVIRTFAGAASSLFPACAGTWDQYIEELDANYTTGWKFVKLQSALCILRTNVP
jgi:hypothetical protein